MITTNYTLSLTPGTVPQVIPVSQYDAGSRILVFSLVDSAGTVSLPSGTQAAVRGTKPDGNAFDYSATISGTTVTVTVTEQMAAIAGKVRCEVYLYKGTHGQSGYQHLGTANFILAVERAPMDKDTIPSDSEIRQLIDIVDRTDEIIAAAGTIESELLNNVVRVDEDQDLTSQEQAQARTNIGALATNQGTSNAGAPMVVDTDGVIRPGSFAVPEAVSEALLACFEKVAWIDDSGQDLYDALAEALNISPTPPTPAWEFVTNGYILGEVQNTDNSIAFNPNNLAGANKNKRAVNNPIVQKLPAGTYFISCGDENGTNNIKWTWQTFVASSPAIDTVDASISDTETTKRTIWSGTGQRAWSNYPDLVISGWQNGTKTITSESDFWITPAFAKGANNDQTLSASDLANIAANFSVRKVEE